MFWSPSENDEISNAFVYGCPCCSNHLAHASKWVASQHIKSLSLGSLCHFTNKSQTCKICLTKTTIQPTWLCCCCRHRLPKLSLDGTWSARLLSRHYEVGHCPNRKLFAKLKCNGMSPRWTARFFLPLRRRSAATHGIVGTSASAYKMSRCLAASLSLSSSITFTKNIKNNRNGPDVVFRTSGLKLLHSTRCLCVSLPASITIIPCFCDWRNQQKTMSFHSHVLLYLLNWSFDQDERRYEHVWVEWGEHVRKSPWESIYVRAGAGSEFIKECTEQSMNSSPGFKNAHQYPWWSYSPVFLTSLPDAWQ